jgi:hypothetical protein
MDCELENSASICELKDNQITNFDLLAAASIGDLGLVHRLLKANA